MTGEWDVFISHAGEDKATVARPLAELLRQAGLRVWLDENELTIGDSLSRKIDEGLARSGYGVVILSRHFFQKGWPVHELTGLTAKQVGARKVILPVWHEVDRALVLSFSPPLADALAANTNQGLPKVAQEVARAIRSPISSGVRSEAPVRPHKLSNRIIMIGTFVLVVLGLLLGINKWLKDSSKKVASVEGRDYERALFWRRNHAPISGYFSASCNTCPRPRAWAFFYPRTEDGRPVNEPERDRRTSEWPAVEFLYPEDKPEVSSCVDLPKGACESLATIWEPKHQFSSNAHAHGPRLRLDLHLIISGFELRVANDGDAVAPGIHVDVVGWQIGAPGAELIKTYTVRDLGPLADYTIQYVFVSPEEMK